MKSTLQESASRYEQSHYSKFARMVLEKEIKTFLIFRKLPLPLEKIDAIASCRGFVSGSALMDIVFIQKLPMIVSVLYVSDVPTI